MQLNTERMYEITEVNEAHIWHTPLDSSACIVGTIIKLENSMCEYNNVYVVKHNHNNFPIGKRAMLALEGLTLRPLNQRDQQDIELEEML